MPLTGKGETIKEAMQEHYGPEKGERVFYASANKGTITGVDEMEKPEDCADAKTFGGVMDQTPVMTPVPPLETEHPQSHPDGSSPPEPALDANFGAKDAAAGYGGVAGGAIPQNWGEGKSWGDAIPSSVGIGDICRANADYWKQWK